MRYQKTKNIHNLFVLNIINKLQRMMFKRNCSILQNFIKRHLSLTRNVNERGEAINMAYATYESTTTITSSPLLIMHGLFGSKTNWNSLSKALQQKTEPQRKIIAVDARNHGESPHTDSHTYENLSEDIRYFLNQMNIDKVCLLGHSMGGRAVMLFALKYPELVDKLIVVDMSPVTISSSLTAMPSIFRAIKAVELPADVPISVARQKADVQLSMSLPDKGLRAFLLTNLVQKDDRSYTWRVNVKALQQNFKQHILRFPQFDNITFTGPILFIGGGSSDYIQKSDHPAILKFFPNADIKYIEGAGHWVHSEKPTEFLQVVLPFLNNN